MKKILIKSIRDTSFSFVIFVVIKCLVLLAFTLSNDIVAPAYSNIVISFVTVGIVFTRKDSLYLHDVYEDD